LQFFRPARRQSKIYAKSNQSDFSRIFDGFTSIQILTIYRRLLLRGVYKIDRNKKRKNDDWDREMFFLLRMAFWLGLVLVLLPREKTPGSEKLPQLGASDAMSAATAAVSDMSQFCKRQPAACEVGGHAATVIGHRAQEGARKLYQIITDKRASDHTGSIGGNGDANGTPVAMTSGDTLTLDDLQADWQVPPAP
jgi:hypothetical protein